MNKNIAILSTAGVLLAVALLVFYVDGDNPSLPDASSSGASNLSADEQKGLRLLKLAQEACLTGESMDGGVKIDLSTDFLSQFKAAAGVHKDKARGAVNYVDEQVRLIADKNIRDCLQEHMPQIKACLLGDCSSASLPKVIDFQFTYKPVLDAAVQELLEKDWVAFSLENRIDNHTIVLQPGKGYYVDSIPLFDKGKKRKVAIAPVVHEGHLPLKKERTEFCLRRAEQISHAPNFTLYDCTQGEGCRHDAMTPKWFDSCEVAGVGFNDFVSPFIRAAYAEDKREWVIPSLSTLQKREDLFGVGYTRFKVEASSAMNNDYDGYYYDIAVNGWKANIDGLPGSYRAKAHDFSKPITMEFGLQNLNFSGVNSGCDEIALTMHFVKDGEQVGSPVTLKRSYVALRDARVKELEVDHSRFRWTGKYQRAPKMYDSEVFASSIVVPGKVEDILKYATATEKAKRDIARMKSNFDALGLRFEGRPLVAVVRPPLRRISYGLAIGTVEETQQIRFTYESKVANNLKEYLLSLREKGTNYRSIIDKGAFVYSIRGDDDYMASPPVCADDR